MEPTKVVISNLKFIGQLQKGDKMNTKFMYRQPDGLVTRLSRTFINYDNRQNALTFIQQTTTAAFKVIVSLAKSDQLADRTMCINMMQDLKQARVGIMHLKDTYSEDLKFKCDMETLLQEIDAQLAEIEVNTPTLSAQAPSPTLSSELSDLHDHSDLNAQAPI